MLALTVCLTINGVALTDSIAQAPPAKLNLARLQQLLRSSKINDLRNACRMIDVYPEQSESVLGSVTQRSNHPALSDICDQMLTNGLNRRIEFAASRFGSHSLDRSHSPTTIPLTSPPVE